MPVRASLPVLLLTAVVALLLLAVSPAAADDKHGGGRMVIIRAPPGKTTSAASTAGDRSRWQRRRVEDEVAPEFAGLLGTEHSSSGALNPGKPVCIGPCVRDGNPYTRPCTYGTLCNGG